MKAQLRPLLLVAVAGAIGGLTSWLLQWLAGLTPFQKPASLGIPALVIVGSVAAVFGVYMMANSNTKELPHTLAFALVCGVFWQPVFDATKLYAANSFTEHQASQQSDVVQALTKTVATDNGSGVQDKVNQATTVTTDVLTKLPSVHNEQLRQKIVSQTNQTVDVIGDASVKAPEASIANLEKIGQVAAQNGQTEVASHVLAKLNSIKGRDPALALQTNRATETIAASTELKMGKGLSTAIKARR